MDFKEKIQMLRKLSRLFLSSLICALLWGILLNSDILSAQENLKPDQKKAPVSSPSPAFSSSPVPSPSPGPSIVPSRKQNIDPMNLIVGQRFIYKIAWRDKLAGYTKFFVDKRMSLAGEGFYKMESLCRMKIGMEGISELAFSSQMTVSSKNLLPTFFYCLQKQGDEEYQVDCLVSNNLVSQQNRSPRGDTVQFQLFDDGNVPMIYFTNLWGRYDTLLDHVWLILKSRRMGKIHVYDPILQQLGYLELVKAEKPEDRIKVNGREMNANHFLLYGIRGNLMFDIWTDENRNILLMEEPGGMGFSFTLSDNEVVKACEESKGVDLWKYRVARSNIFLPNPRDIERLKVEVKAEGGQFEPQYEGSPFLVQKFDGKLENGILEGRFALERKTAEIKKPLLFPIKTPMPEEFGQYMKPAPGIESEDDLVKNKALEVAWRSKDVWEASVKINKWIAENITFGVALPSARMTVANGQGNGESRALLAIALCRSLGIPARKVGGVLFSAGNFIPHYWYEVYVGEQGWIPLDPSTGEEGALGATHIRLFTVGDLKNLSVQVLDFSPRPPERLTFINREITWPVGEERVYAVKRDGEKIGSETALMDSVGVLNDQEVYVMKLASILKIGGRDIASNASFWTTPQGLPVKFLRDVRMGSLSESQEFVLKDDVMIQTVKSSSDEFTREIPFSKGAYLADPQFLCQWAMVGGQFYNVNIGMKYRFYVFIPETLTVEAVTATVKQFESVESGEKIYDCFRVDTNKGITFWIDRKNQIVVKISFTNQKVDLELESTKLKI